MTLSLKGMTKDGLDSSSQVRDPSFAVITLGADYLINTSHLPLLRACSILSSQGSSVFVVVDAAEVVLDGTSPSLGQEVSKQALAHCESMLRRSSPNGKLNFVESLPEMQKLSFLDFGRSHSSIRFPQLPPHVQDSVSLLKMLLWSRICGWMFEEMKCKTIISYCKPRCRPADTDCIVLKPMPPETVIPLASSHTSALELYQYCLGFQDDSCLSMLQWMADDISGKDVQEIQSSHRKNPARRYPHRILAAAMTKFAYGSQIAERAMACSNLLFGGVPVRSFDESTLEGITPLLPTERLRTWIDTSGSTGLTVVELMLKCKLCCSKAEAKRTLAQGGVRMNDQTLSKDFMIGSDWLLFGKYLFLQRGKKTFRLVILEGAPWEKKGVM